LGQNEDDEDDEYDDDEEVEGIVKLSRVHGLAAR
jgi:hypothetical protein